MDSGFVKFGPVQNIGIRTLLYNGVAKPTVSYFFAGFLCLSFSLRFFGRVSSEPSNPTTTPDNAATTRPIATPRRHDQTRRHDQSRRHDDTTNRDAPTTRPNATPRRHDQSHHTRPNATRRRHELWRHGATTTRRHNDTAPQRHNEKTTQRHNDTTTDQSASEVSGAPRQPLNDARQIGVESARNVQAACFMSHQSCRGCGWRDLFY